MFDVHGDANEESSSSLENKESSSSSSSASSSLPSSSPSASLESVPPSSSSSSSTSPSTSSMKIFQLDEDDVNYVTNRIDYYASLYKADVASRLNAMLTRHQTDKQTIVAQQRAIEQIQRNLNQTEQERDANQHQLQRLALHHDKLRQQLILVALEKSNKRRLVASFQAWHELCRVIIAQGRRPLGGLRSHYSRRLIKNLFLEWRLTSRENRIQRKQEMRERETQAIRLRLEEEHHGQVQALKNEIRNLTSKVRASDFERESLEERMRQAFARGVCALNKEALAAFSVSSEQESRDRTIQVENEPPDSNEPRHIGASTLASSVSFSSSSLSSAQSRPMNVSFSDIASNENQSPTENSNVVYFQPIPLRLTAPYQPEKSIAHPFSSSRSTSSASASSTAARRSFDIPKPRTQIPVATSASPSSNTSASVARNRATNRK